VTIVTDLQAPPAEPTTVDGELAAIRGCRPDTPKEHVLTGLLNTMFRHDDPNAAQILVDSQTEQALDQKIFDKEEELLQNRPAAEAAGVDLAAVKAADPDFDGQDFLTIVRETFERVRHARSQDDLERTDAALSPELEAQLKTVVAGDVASHRHHLLPGLEIRSAQIQSTEVVDGKIQIAVGLHLRSEEVDLDDEGKVVAGDYTAELHRDDLIHDWELARREQHLDSIAPLP
jgi:predicted lipid-binding transport protein (Tim44 family)